MSSVSGSSNNRSQQDDAVRRTREEYQEREDQGVKKKNNDVKRLSQLHAQEIERLKNQHSAQLENLKNEVREAMTDRDMKYQKDINDLRGMHKQQLEKAAYDNESTRENSRKTSKEEIRMANERSIRQRQNLEQNLQNEIIDEKKNFEDSLGEIRENQKQTIQQQRENLNKAHTKELTTIRQGREEAVGDSKHDLDLQRRHAKTQMTETERNHRNEVKRLSENFQNTLGNEREGHSESQQMDRKAFQDSLVKLKNKYEGSSGESAYNRDLQMEKFKDQIENRIESQVNRLQSENQNQKAASIRERIAMGRQNEREKQHVVEQAQLNIQDLQEQRDQVYDLSREQSAKDINRAVKQNQELMGKSELDKKRELQLANQINREALAQTESSLGNQNKMLKETGDLRVRRVYDEYNRNQQKIDGMYSERVKDMGATHENKLQIQRDALLKEKNDAVVRLTNQIQDQEIKHTVQLADVTENYEKQIRDLREQNLADKRKYEDQNRRMVEQMQKAHKLDMETVQNQTSGRIKQVEQRHDEEIRRLHHNHEEKIAEITTSIKKS
jgi:hypothetical protein